MAPAFRSQLEIKVAAELSHQGVAWEYEAPAKLPDGRSPRYLPDFTIKDAREELQLPGWVECKPQDFLYALRDLLGVTRTHGERFSGDVSCADVDSSALKGLFVEELWKPKLLAELTGEPVLVVGTVGGISSLSVEMRSDEIRFSRSHPFVNWLGIQKAKEREQKRLQWEAESAERQRQWEADNARRQVESEKRRAVILAEALSARHIGPTKWDKPCCGCGSWVSAGAGSLRKVRFTDGSHEWRVVCSGCRGL